MYIPIEQKSSILDFCSSIAVYYAIICIIIYRATYYYIKIYILTKVMKKRVWDLVEGTQTYGIVNSHLDGDRSILYTDYSTIHSKYI